MGTSKRNNGRFGLNKNQRDLFIALILIFVTDIIVFLLTDFTKIYMPVSVEIVYLLFTISFDIGILIILAFIYRKRNIQERTKRVVRKKRTAK